MATDDQRIMEARRGVRDLFAVAPTMVNGHEISVLSGDSFQLIPRMDADSVQCCVTSPPYWGLRDYDHPAQIGAEASPIEYVKNLVNLFREVRRVLCKDGTLWLNIGDSYARNGGTGKHGPNAVVGNTRRMIQKRNCSVPDCWGLKDRDLMGIPWRVAFAMQEDGWILRSAITWVKKTAMPESVKNRPTSATEDVFLFAKNPTYYYDSSAVREPTGANLRNCWVLGPDISGKGHPATFPRELARRCILLGSRIGDTVLDPFGGSGTTGVVAQELKRKAVLIELNPGYAQMGRKRVTHGETNGIKAKDTGVLFEELRQGAVLSGNSGSKRRRSRVG
jgi:site-specific DNA-methyltransferase (cytosine-N4-specific)